MLFNESTNSDLKSGLECIRSYTTRCMTPDQRQHFNLLYHGTGELIHELCEESGYQRGTFLINFVIKSHSTTLSELDSTCIYDN